MLTQCLFSVLRNGSWRMEHQNIPRSCLEGIAVLLQRCWDKIFELFLKSWSLVLTWDNLPMSDMQCSWDNQVRNTYISSRFQVYQWSVCCFQICGMSACVIHGCMSVCVIITFDCIFLTVFLLSFTTRTVTSKSNLCIYRRVYLLI